MSSQSVQKTMIARDRVVSPPDRFINVTDGELLSYFKGVFSEDETIKLNQLHELIEGLSTSEFSSLRRRLEQDFSLFAHAANATPGTDPRERDPMAYAAELDAQESRFLTNFLQLLEAGHYKLLTSAEWDAAQAEEFLLTLPVAVNYEAMDGTVLPRALWSVRPQHRSEAPPELADRMLIFHRGVDVANIQGLYIMRKVDLILSFFILQPLYKLFAWIMAKCGVKKFVPEAPDYLAPAEDAEAKLTEAAALTEQAAAAIDAGDLHEASINVERKTFARTFPDGTSVLKQMHKKVSLQEACLKDVIVLYRNAVPDAGLVPGEMDIIKPADPAFLQRNFVIKRFAGIPIADLEMVFPDKKIFMPPQVFINMAITIIGMLVVLITMITGGIAPKMIWTTLTMLGGRAYGVYAAAMYQRTVIERAMQKLLYDRTMASQEAVLSSLTDEMARQRTRELFVAYCILASSSQALSPAELDSKCESFLVSQFGLKVDFTTEDALPTLRAWGMVVETGTGDAVAALPLQESLIKLDETWDNFYDFSTPAAAKQPSQILGKVLFS